MIKVLRKPTTANVLLKFEFDVDCNDFLVKNFTSGKIYVSQTEEVDKFKSVLVGSECGQDLVIHQQKNVLQVGHSPVKSTRTLYVLPEQTSDIGVEIQAVRW